MPNHKQLDTEDAADPPRRVLRSSHKTPAQSASTNGNSPEVKKEKSSSDAPRPSHAPNQDMSDDCRAYEVNMEDKAISCERRGSAGSAMIYTHGAGGGIESPAMQAFAAGFATIAPIVCFQGNMNLKSRIKAFHRVVKDHGEVRALGGRSMGARAAVLTVLEQESPDGVLILQSYPLTAGKEGTREPERREQILLDLPPSTDVLFIIGTKDVQCDIEQLDDLRRRMAARSWLVKVEGADHGMDVRPKKYADVVRAETGRLAAQWLDSRDVSRLECELSFDAEDEFKISSAWT